MKISATRLRENFYNILDEILATGEPVQIERNGKTLKIVPEKKSNIFERIERHPDLIVGDPEDLVHIDWSGHWKPDNDLS